MEPWKIILIVVGIYFAVMILYSLVVYVMINKTIRRRGDKNPLLKYFTASYYEGLKTNDFSFTTTNDVLLNGKVYHRDNLEKERMLVFFHGFGAGHEAYTTLINDLVTTLNMPLITFDYTGCDLSEGDKIPSTLQALADGQALLQFLSIHDEFKDKKLILVGHSWGGFVASNLYPFNKTKKIESVISINGVTDFPMLYKIKAHAPYIFIPFYNLIMASKYKALAFANTRKSIKDTPIPHLFIHGLLDDSIPYTPHISTLILQSDKFHKVKFHFEKEKYHNAYLTIESEANLRLLQKRLKHIKDNANDEDTVKEIKTTDFTNLVENDTKVLAIIKHFVEESK